ncbi:MAG: valine--tRNA ligase [Candidatus Azambacteria bacterium]|nr:valine--tRNA ligase [Candidatus Azambacteria bacterium]
MKFDSPYNPKEVEEKIYKLWEKSGFFNPDNLKNAKKPFTIVIPPPNITGSLHMGHALNVVIQDILIRFKRMAGFKTLWVPGTDHAGIATQSMVEKKLKKEGKTRFDLGREKFMAEVWKWKNEYGNKIFDQLKRLGASCDWSRARFTMDKDYSAAVLEAFIQYYNQGWIYRGERVVNWCPRCQTSLSDLELEHKEEKGKLYFIKYPLKSQNYIIVATTRPETMLGDTAVAVNPKDERYKKLVGQMVILPLVNREIPIIADRAIDINFGTGAVKVTPAHSLVDWQIGQNHNLPTISVIDEHCRLNANAPEIYRDMKIEEARKKIVEDLSALNLIEKIEDYTHSVPKCYRCGSTVELILSKQWFVKMEKLAKLAISPIKNGKIKFHPKRWERVYLDWLKNAHDWCISRQIWWGHQLPVWFCLATRDLAKPDKNSNDEYFIVSLKKPKKCPFCKKCAMKQSEDVFDTWFSSALWPFAVLGWPKKTKDLSTYYPTDVLSTARDIINLWVARMVYSGAALAKKLPFKDVIIHATVITKEGRRMSKSLGTGIDPLELVEKYGADATRFGLAWQISETQDMRFGEDDILAGKKFCNKIWNASRFVLQNADSKFKIENLTPADKKILLGLKKLQKDVGKFIEKYEFGKALHCLYEFFWHQYADIYIETAKKQPANVLLYVHLNLLKLLHPFLPFITEELWKSFSKFNGSKKLLLIENWPK